MWPGAGSIIGGGSTETDTYATTPSNIPTTTAAKAIWTPDDAAFYLNNEFLGLEWPTIQDPSIANVKVCLHMNRHGQNGNLRMLPVTSSPNDCDGYEHVTIEVAGILTDERVAGAYTWRAGNGSIIHNITNALSFSTSDLTAEGFFYPADAITGHLWDFRASAADTTRPTIRTNAGKLALTVNAVDIIIAGSKVSPANTWHHFAWCRDSGTSYLYLDGVSVGSTADTRNYGNVSSAHIGNNVSENSAAAQYNDEYRLTIGVARYPGGTTFTVPSVPFPDY